MFRISSFARKIALPVFLAMFSLGIVTAAMPALAQTAQPDPNAPNRPIVLDDPLQTGGDIRVVFARGIQLMTGISGSLALAAFVWGGFLMLTAAGDAGKIEKGKNTLKYAVMGLVMIFGAYVALRAVYGVFGV